MHVPLILKLPHDRRAGVVIDAPLVSNLDVYATILAAAGIDDPTLDGVSHDLAGEPYRARSLLIGEYTASKAYLRQLLAANGAFDLEAHLRDRYVVYTHEFRTEIVAGRAIETTSMSLERNEARLAAAARDAEQALSTYLAGRTLRMNVGSPTIDAEIQRELEALGYVGPGEPASPPQPPARRRE
jgi:arylsulfatase A-like enzyme